MKYSCIGITGRKFSGKDTVGGCIAQAAMFHGLGSKRIFFAEPIKQACSVIFGWSMRQMEDYDFKETVDERYGISPRHALVTLGTEWGRDLINPEIWVKVAEARIKETPLDVIPYITDLRFENEAAMVRRLGGVVVHVDDGRPVDEEVHRSEAGIAMHPADVRFLNDKSAGIGPVASFASSLFAW